jgi:hypothetical protein
MVNSVTLRAVHKLLYFVSFHWFIDGCEGNVCVWGPEHGRTTPCAVLSTVFRTNKHRRCLHSHQWTSEMKQNIIVCGLLSGWLNWPYVITIKLTKTKIPTKTLYTEICLLVLGKFIIESISSRYILHTVDKLRTIYSKKN